MPVIIMIVAAGAYLALMKRDYVSQGSLMVNGPSLLASLSSLSNANSDVWLTPAQATTNEIGELVQTDAFIRAIIQGTDLEAEMALPAEQLNEVFDAIRENIYAVPQGDNQTLITVASDDPVIAYQLVNSLIDNYIQWKINSQKTESQTALTFFSGLIEEYKAELDVATANLQTYILAHPAPVRGDRPYLEAFEIERLNAEVSLAQVRYNSALNNEENAKLSLQQVETEAQQTYVMVDAPEIPTKPETSLRRIALNLSIFVVAGAVLSLGLIFITYLLDNTVRFSQDVKTQLDLPVLAVVPDTTKKTITVRQRLQGVLKLKMLDRGKERKQLAVQSTDGKG
jgi:uncharacterized protein involved in exopolysaccharide biosynthesis